MSSTPAEWRSCPASSTATSTPKASPLLYDVLVGNPFEVEFVTIQSIVDEAEGAGGQDAARRMGPGLLLRRHEGEGRPALKRADLDRVSTVHPVAVIHRGGHTVFFNSKAFELAGITQRDAAAVRRAPSTMTRKASSTAG